MSILNYFFITGKEKDRDREVSSWTANSWLFPLTAANFRFDLITSAPSPLGRRNPLHVLNHHSARLSSTLPPFIFTFAFPLSAVTYIDRTISFFFLIWRAEYARVINLHSLRCEAASQFAKNDFTFTFSLRSQRILSKKRGQHAMTNYE